MAPSAAELAERLEADRYQDRRDAAHVLGTLGDDAELAIARIGKQVEDGNWRIRKAAATALGELSIADVWGQYPSAMALRAVPELAKRLGDRDIGVRRAAREPYEALRKAAKLGDMDAASASGVEALIHRLTDEDWNVREIAAQALGDMGAAAAPALPLLARLLGDKSDRVRSATKVALEELCYCKFPDGKLLQSPIHLGAMGAPACPHLIKRCSHSDWRVRCAAAWALGTVGGGPAVGAIHLADALDDNDWAVRLLAVEAFGDLGIGGLPAVPKLCARLADLEDRVRKAAFAVISRLETQILGDWGAEEIPVLARILARFDDPSPHERKDAIMALAAVGVAASPATPQLLRIALDSNPEVAETAARALEGFGSLGLFGWFGDRDNYDNLPVRVPIVAALRRRLGDDEENPAVRFAAAEALAKLATHASRVVPKLLRLRDGENAVLSHGAKRLLEKLSGGGAMRELTEVGNLVTPELIDCLADAHLREDDLVKELVSEALRGLYSVGLVPDLVDKLDSVQDYVDGTDYVYEDSEQ